MQFVRFEGGYCDKVELKDLTNIAENLLRKKMLLMVAYGNDAERQEAETTFYSLGLRTYNLKLSELEGGDAEIPDTDVTLIDKALLMGRCLFGSNNKIVQAHRLCIMNPGEETGQALQALGRFSREHGGQTVAYFTGEWCDTPVVNGDDGIGKQETLSLF